MLVEYLNLALRSIRHRKLRSWLTVVGIVIGVAAIISLITISRSLETTIKDQFEQFGANRIMISAKGFQGPGTSSEGLTVEDVETIQKIGGFSYVLPALFRNAEVHFNRGIGFAPITALPTENFKEFYEDTGVGLQEGRYIKEGEKNVALVGARAATEMFTKEIRVGNKITLNNRDFKVVGIVEEIGNAQDDNQVVIPLETARELFKEPEDVDAIIAQVKTTADIPQLQEKISKELERKRGDTNFQVLTASQILEQITQVLGIMQVVLVGIAAISLVVGAIGIMNSMYTSVLERTKEIGIMKAIGARNSDVLLIFVIESGLIGVVGGILGILLGVGIALGVGSISQQAGFSLTITIEPLIIVFGLIFAFVVGVVSGLLPAYQGSKLKPVDALRYE
ncbi:ABC transporter permease [Candidatus Woesearchaeota archaeon]|nr:ABC transporter permease [Candidatus Woesearchaeota archaeon]